MKKKNEVFIGGVLHSFTPQWSLDALFSIIANIMVYGSIIQFRSRRTFVSEIGKKKQIREDWKSIQYFQTHSTDTVRICVEEEGEKKIETERIENCRKSISWIPILSLQRKKKIIFQQSVIRSFAISTFWMKGWRAIFFSSFFFFFCTIPSFNFHKIFRFHVIYFFFFSPHYPTPRY